MGPGKENEGLAADERVIELRIPSKLGWERSAADLAASVARRMGFPDERVQDIRTAVAEATMNAIEHGNEMDARRDVLIVLAPESERLQINVQDASTKPFPTEAVLGDQPGIEPRLDGEMDTRGWGTFLIRTLVDEVEFSSTGEGNVVHMVVRLDGPIPGGNRRDG